MTFSTLADVLRHRAVTDAGRLAYAFGEERLSYGELLQDSLRLAAQLAELGVGPGDRVALVLPSGLDFVRAFWAVQLAGAASAAINPFTPSETTQRRIARIRPRAIINTSGAAAAPAAEGGEGVDGRVPKGANEPAPEAGAAPQLAFLQPTSGTSGEPRAAMVLQRNVLAVQRAAVEAFSLGPSDVLVSWVPPWHDLGLVRFVIGAVFFGAPCHIVTPAVQTIPQWLAKIAEVRGTITGAPDFAFRLAARHADPRGLDLGSLRYVTNGGEPVRFSTIAAFEERFGLAGIVRPGYGLAEATLGVTSLRPGEPMRVDERGHVSCGRPLPEVEVRIADDGQILVRGPGVFAGYFEAPEATAEVLRDGWLHTGDIGRLDDDGHLYIHGRRRAMLKRGGAMVAPRELEEPAQGVEGVRIAAAVGLSGDGLSEEIAVAVEADPQQPLELLTVEIAHAVRRVLGFKPCVVVLRPRSIPLTANGKVRHDVLRAKLNDGSLEDAILFDGRR